MALIFAMMLVFQNKINVFQMSGRLLSQKNMHILSGLFASKFPDLISLDQEFVFSAHVQTDFRASRLKETTTKKV